MALATNGDKTGDNTKVSEKNKKFIEAIEKYKKDTGDSWTKIIDKIYDQIEEDEELKEKYKLNNLQDDKEDEEKKDFSKRLQKLIERNKKGKNQEDTNLNGEPISLKKICELLYLNTQKELKNKEIYIQVNTDVLYERPILWEEWFIPKALKEVELAVEQGYPEAQTILAHFYYYHGKNGIRNVKKALDLYHSAAEQGYRFALYQLGLMYEYEDKDGDIVPNKDKSYKFYKGSADQDFPLALNKLAYHHFNKKEWEQFFYYAEKAKEKDDVIGMLYLAYAYQKGIGTTEDIEEAIKLYKELLNNIEAAPYRMEIQWTLAKLYKQSKKEITAKEYFDKAFETLKQGWKKVWEDNKLDIFEQMFNTTPDRYNNILAAAHYDYVHNPQKLTVISAFTGS